MKTMVYTTCILFLTGSMAFAVGFKDDPKVYLKDSNSVTHISQLILPTLAFNKDIPVPSGFANQNGPLLFQGGKEVALDKVDKSKSYCALGGSYTGEGDKNEHLFRAGQRLRIKGPSTYQSVESTMSLTTAKFSNAKEYTVDMQLQGGYRNTELNEMYLEKGALTKTAFPYPEDDFDTFFGNLKCFKFSKMPTVGDIRKIIGSQNLLIMPDQTEPMAFQPGIKEFKKYSEENYFTEIKELINELKSDTRDTSKINTSSIRKDSYDNLYQKKGNQSSASRQ